jgi:hypothetical protein
MHKWLLVHTKQFVVSVLLIKWLQMINWHIITIYDILAVLEITKMGYISQTQAIFVDIISSSDDEQLPDRPIAWLVAYT